MCELLRSEGPVYSLKMNRDIMNIKKNENIEH